MKNNHEIILKQYAAYCKEQPLYLGTAGSYGMEMLTIIREGVWAEYDILAAFHPPVGAAVQVRVGANNQIGVPIEATAEKGMGEIVFAGYKEGVRQIAVDVLYKVAPSSGASGTEPAEPTPDMVQQIMLAANAAEKLAQSVRDDADVGKFTGAKGDKGDIGPTGPKGEQGPKGERGEKGDPGKDAVIDTTLSRAGEAADAAEVGKLKEDLTALVTVDYETVTTDRYEKRGELYSNKRFYFSSQGFVGYKVYVGDYDRKKLLEVDVKEGQKYKIVGQSGSAPRYNSAFAFVDENNICISYHWEKNNNSAVNTTVPPNAVKLYVQAATIEPEAQLVIGHSTTYTNKSINTINRVLLDNNLSKFDDKFQVVAYSVITNDPAPINTKEHFENAAIKEFDSLKGDIAVTSDGALIMCHDKGYTFNSDGRITKYDASNSTAIHDMTYAQVKSLEFEKQHNGTYVNPCDIDEFLRICKKYGKFPYITIRDEFMDVVVPTLITKLNYYHLSHKCIVNSFTLESLKAVRAASSEIYLSRVLNYKKMATTQNVDDLANLGLACLCIFDDATMINENAEVCNYARTKGVRVWGGQGRTQNDIDAYINAGYSGVQSYVPLDAT